MVYVTPGEDYDHAINIAIDCFPELRDVERQRICLDVRVVLSNQHEKRTVQIGRTAWSVVAPTLARFEIVEVRVAPSPKSATVFAAAASSSSTPPVVEPPPSEISLYPNAKGSQTNLDPQRPPMPSLTSERQSPGHTHRVVVDFTGMIMHLVSSFKRIACIVISHLGPLHLGVTTLM